MIHVDLMEDGVWHVELRRPAKRNALGVEMYSLLAAAFNRLGQGEDARAVVLSGQGPTFCAGNDLAEFATQWPQPPGGPVVQFLQALAGLPVPVLAAVQGGAVGIGATLLLHCDVVVADPGAFLQFPFVDLGITVEGAGSLLLPQRIGAARAMDLLLTGRRIYADEALDIGLVSRISRDRTPLATALGLAREIAAKPAGAVAATKRLIRLSSLEAVSSRFEQEIAMINELLVASRAQDDATREVP
jgi:enoyl-CoA hydratase/carnithine racemase